MIFNVNGVRLEVDRITNLEVFSFDISDILPEPQVPKFYIEEQDRWEDNYNHPTYHAAMSVYFAGKTLALFDILLKNHIDVVDKNQIIIPKNLRRMYPDDDDKFIFLKYMLLTEDEDIGNIVNLITLTETRVYYIFKSLRVLREGMDIHKHDVKHTVNTNIEYEPLVLGGHQLVHPIDEYNGCITSNISYTDWLEHKFSLDAMARTIAMYRLNKIIEIHSGDAAQIESERKSRSKK
jgi:hypothetical protein